MEGAQSNRWGWSTDVSVSAITDDPISFDLYAGAAQCDYLGKGTLVGTVTLSSTGSIKYNLDTGFYLEEVHVWHGATPAPPAPGNKKKGYVFAPGQYNCNPVVSSGVNFGCPCKTSSNPCPYYIFHAVVCGAFKQQI